MLTLQGDEGWPVVVRDAGSVMTCLKRALKMANAAQQQSAIRGNHSTEAVALYVEILNHYLYFFDQGLDTITPSVIQVCLRRLEMGSLTVHPHTELVGAVCQRVGGRGVQKGWGTAGVLQQHVAAHCSQSGFFQQGGFVVSTAQLPRQSVVGTSTPHQYHMMEFRNLISGFFLFCFPTRFP